MKYRNEKDVLGNVRLPADAYYGSETMRAYNNFQISGMKVAKELVYAYVMSRGQLLLQTWTWENLTAGKAER
jgi:Fumarase